MAFTVAARADDIVRCRHTAVILFTMCLGVFIAQLDSQVVNLAIKHIGSDLDASISQLQWMMDSYHLLYATLLLTGGTLGDLYGRVRIFVVGVGLIVLGSIACAAAPNGTILMAGRALTGIGAALEVPTTLAILTAAYRNSKERAHAIGIWAGCNGLALAVGPTIGGLLVDAAGWRSIFILVIPVCALAMARAVARVPESSDPKGASSISRARPSRSSRSGRSRSSRSKDRIGVLRRPRSLHSSPHSSGRGRSSSTAIAPRRARSCRSNFSAIANSTPRSRSPA